MESGGVYDDSRMSNVLLKNEMIPCSSHVLDSLWLPNSSPSFHGNGSIVSFEGEDNTEKPFFTQIEPKLENCNEEFDACFHQPEKKRRLAPDQVQFLEKSFEIENKLEPERKIQLARELGLQPRQVAIWFQNRRARYKTKVLEKEYDSLKGSYDKLKLDYDALFEENVKMKNEVKSLTEKLLDGKTKPEQCEAMSPLELQPKYSQNSAEDIAQVVEMKQEEAASSVKSDVFDSDSPHYTDGNNSGSLEPGDSSHVFEPEAEAEASDEDDNSLIMMPQLCFPKLEIECSDDLQPNACNLGFPVQDQGTWFWQY